MADNSTPSSNSPANSPSRALSPIAPDAQANRPLTVRGPARNSPSAIENTITPAFLLWVFRQWWKIGIPTGLALAAITAATVLYFYVPRFEARSLLMIEDFGPYVAFNEAPNAGQSIRYIQTQLEILRSPVVLEPALSRPEIASIREFKESAEPIQLLQEGLSVVPLGRSELYYVRYSNPVAKDAAAVVNAVVEEYMLYNSRDDADRTRKVIDILEDERLRRAVEVERLRTQLVRLSEEATGKDPYTGSTKDFTLSANPLGSLFQSLTELELDREMLKAQKQFLTETKSGDHDPLETSGLLKMEIDTHEEVRKREEAILALESQQEEIKADAVRYQKNPQWKSSPAYVAVEKDIEQRRTDLEEFKSKLRTMVLSQRREQQKLERAQEIAKVDQQLEELDARSKLLSARFDERLNEHKSGEGKSVQLEFARAALAREEKVFELIASRKLALQTEMRAPARVRLTRKADVPSVPIIPVPYKVLLVACSMALCAPFGLAVAKEFLDRRISDVDQLAQEARLRILGEISELPVRHVAVSPGKMTGRMQRESQVFAESINSLRTNLSVAEDLRNNKVFAVTSPCSGESKSSVAVSLAMSIANATSKPTLIIDADMRSPDVASMLKTKSQPGLFEVLSGECKLEDAIHHVGDSSLYVIPAGRATRSTHHLVQVEEMKQLLDRLRPKFCAIILDTPPILGASESLILTKSVDAALLCSLSGVSKVKQVKMAVERLEHAGVNVAGAVLSGSSVGRYSYRYGYYPIENATET
jgi:succinoglycan biosynthesis transport protein ExoP